ncbi:hypothetical protein [Streptomyces jumonjinensis]|uniref:Uncharacterized protein n=1 Tax=Streptomyces jumonjinensis TaxID=1945 RepID=A0A646KPW0_STRJU|nr:hypothetical protein [Streptomyces jumonjinensis]MQT04097.1 hypothetical protein [Streptomyces jumonjinensis]
MPEEPTPLFVELADRLATALEDWAACFREATDGRQRASRQGVVRALDLERQALERAGRRAPRKIDGPLLSYWAKGADQLRPGVKRNRFPAVEDCEAIGRALAGKAPESARRLPGIGREIVSLAGRLETEAGTDWREEVIRWRENRTAPGTGPVAAQGAAGRQLQRPADAPDTVSPSAAEQPAPAAAPQRAHAHILRPARWRAALIAVVLTAAAATGIRFAAWDHDDAGRLAPALSTPAPLALTCSADWRPIPQAFLSLKPCLERKGNKLFISAKVKAVPEGDLLPQQNAVVWLWLMREDRAAEAKGSFLSTRHESTLRRCPIPMHRDGRITVCGPFPVSLPAREGTYTTSTEARLRDAVHPPGWTDPAFAGTQGAKLVWQGTG